METRGAKKARLCIVQLSTKEHDTIEFSNMVYEVLEHMHKNKSYVFPEFPTERAAVNFFANAMRYLKRTMQDHGSRFDLMRRIVRNDWNSRTADAFFSVWWSFRDALCIYDEPMDFNAVGIDLHRVRTKHPVARDPTLYPFTVFVHWYAGDWRRELRMHEMCTMSEFQKRNLKMVLEFYEKDKTPFTTIAE